MQAGKLRHRVEVQSTTETVDAHGGVVRTWTTDATRWASIEPLRMRESFEAQQIEAKISHRIIMRHYPSLVSSQRILHGARVFNIHSIRNIEERDIMTEVLAMEDV